MNLHLIKKCYYGDIPDESAGGNSSENEAANSTPARSNNWPLWEVFIRSKQGLDHKHAGSLHAVDAAMAIENARDVYTRRQEGVSIWVIESKHIHASNPDDAASFYEPAEDKIYRYPTFYDLPEEVKHMKNHFSIKAVSDRHYQLQMQPIMENFNAINSTQNLKDTTLSQKILFKNKECLLLHLADTNLILSQRNAAWCGHGPILEQDIAITNISLDLLGQARNFYQYAARIINEENTLNAATNEVINNGESLQGTTEDSLAYLRTERAYKNLLIVEQLNGDWGQTILRQYLYSQFQYLLYQQLRQSCDQELAAIVEKALKEVAYHVRWSSEWVIRLGDGTPESHARMLTALDEVWRFTGEFFIPAEYENEETIGFALNSLKQPWIDKVAEIFEAATLPSPNSMEGIFMQTGGKTGIHTEQLGFILAEMQYLQRTYPNSVW